MCHLSTSSSRVSVWALELNARCIAYVGMEVRDQEFVNQCDAVDPVLNDRPVHERQEYMDLIDASEPDHAALSTCHLLAHMLLVRLVIACAPPQADYLEVSLCLLAIIL